VDGHSRSSLNLSERATTPKLEEGQIFMEFGYWGGKKGRYLPLKRGKPTKEKETT